MQGFDEIVQFIIDALSANAAKGQGSVVTLKVSPYIKDGRGKKEHTRVITADDVLDAHEILSRFDGDFRKLFGKSSQAKDNN